MWSEEAIRKIMSSDKLRKVGSFNCFAVFEIKMII